MRGWQAIATTLFLGATLSLYGHALLQDASPQAGSTITGPDVAVMLRFNVRIDSQRSLLELFTPRKETVVLKIEPQDSPAILGAHLRDLKPGSYMLHWQALAIDGHITRGDVPFTVKK